MERFALLFTVKPGTEEQAANLFKTYGRPSAQASSNTKLVSTSVFMKGNIVIRIFDIEGSLDEAVAFLSQQQAIHELEEKLNPLLEHPRDFTDPEIAKRFFEQSLMTRLTHREAGRPVAG